MPVNLPPAFQFSQSSLQDYADCARRFQLRYVLEQDWPAPVAEPLGDAERAETLGKHFHRLLERYWLDLPIVRQQIAPELRDWWDAFQQHPLEGLPKGVRQPEITTSAEIAGQRFVATFDLLAYDAGGEAVIVDWKTGKRRSSRAWLDRRLQTIVYPLLLADSSARLLGYQVKPEQVKLIYWFANAPADVEIFQYSAVRLKQDRQTIKLLLDQLQSTADNVWPLTPNINLCRWCQYRSLCERGVEAGPYDDNDTESDDAEVIIVPDAAPTNDYVL